MLFLKTSKNSYTIHTCENFKLDKFYIMINF